MHLINYNRSVAINILGVFVINTTLQVIINLFAAALLIVIAINENQQFNRHLTRERLFLIMVYTNIILCLSDAIAWSLENTQGAFYYLLNQVFTSVSFIAMPILTYTWFLYVIFTIYRDDACFHICYDSFQQKKDPSGSFRPHGFLCGAHDHHKPFGNPVIWYCS